MKTALDMLNDDHRRLAAILHAMGDVVARIRDGGRRPDFGALRAMLYYLDAFSARLHHPQEDELLFQPLHARGGEAEAIVDDLEREHVRVAEALRSLEQALLRYEEGGDGEFVAFATAVEGFCGFYLQHMYKEETLVLPLARRLFSRQERARIEARWVAARAPQGGMDEVGDLHRLFRRIVGARAAPS